MGKEKIWWVIHQKRTVGRTKSLSAWAPLIISGHIYIRNDEHDSERRTMLGQWHTLFSLRLACNFCRQHCTSVAIQIESSTQVGDALPKTAAYPSHMVWSAGHDNRCVFPLSASSYWQYSNWTILTTDGFRLYVFSTDLMVNMATLTTQMYHTRLSVFFFIFPSFLFSKPENSMVRV